jgi:hypothetical protein
MSEKFYEPSPWINPRSRRFPAWNRRRPASDELDPFALDGCSLPLSVQTQVFESQQIQWLGRGNPNHLLIIEILHPAAVV